LTDRQAQPARAADSALGGSRRACTTTRTETSFGSDRSLRSSSLGHEDSLPMCATSACFFARPGTAVAVDRGKCSTSGKWSSEAAEDAVCGAVVTMLIVGLASPPVNLWEGEVS